ncbi:MAG: polymer-forming cytoskeletal protein, partial [Thermorudis peleae]|nr:polymer-forming cytoskeletal protein [Thermorudis peleae]
MRQRMWRWCVLVAIVASLTSTLWLWQPTTKAATFFSEGISTTEIPADQTIDDDVYIVGGSATIAGHVLRNVFVVAGSVRITGTVDGDVNVLGNTVEVSGPVRGSVRAAGRTVRINGPVGWDALLLGQSVTLGPNAVVDHEARIAGNDGLVQGHVQGDLRAALSQLTLQGQVDGTVHASVQTLTLGSGAVIGGDLDYEAPRQAT